MAVESTRLNPRELLAQMGPQMYRTAYSKGMSLSSWLDTQVEPEKDGLDGFERLLSLSGLYTRSDPAYGVYAVELDAFDKDEHTRALVPELIARMWRRSTLGRRTVYGSGDFVPGSIMSPYAEDMGPRFDNNIAPVIPLSQLVAITTPITGDTYRAFYLTTDATQQRMVRVGETAEVPRAKLTGGEHTVRLYKFGRTLEASYEVLRRQRIDRIALHVALMAAQTEADKVTAVMDVIVNGDGNTGTAAAVHKLTDLDTAASHGTLTLKGWLAYKMKYANPFSLSTVLCNEDVALQLMLLQMGSANWPLVNIQAQSGFGSLTQINPGLRDGVALGWTADAPSLKIVGIDRRFAIERVFEIGADISEVERYTTRQTQTLTMTEIEGYAVFSNNAALILDVND
jgi:hypothetical protein